MCAPVYVAMGLDLWIGRDPAGARLARDRRYNRRSAPNGGLFSAHYWVLVKLLLTVPAVIMMLEHTRPVGYVAGAAVAAAFSSQRAFWAAKSSSSSTRCFRAARLVGRHRAWSTYKPRGRTSYGWP